MTDAYAFNRTVVTYNNVLISGLTVQFWMQVIFLCTFAFSKTWFK